MNEQKEYNDTLVRYEKRFGPLPFDLQLYYGNAELVRLMKKALHENRQLKQSDEPEFVCL